MTNIENALKIDGWMQPVELEWLATQAATRKVVIEVGSWMGRSTRAIADNLPEGGVVYAVDTWLGSDEPNHKRLLAGKPLSPEATKVGDNWLLDQFGNNMGEAHFAEPLYRVRCVQKTSVEAAKYLHTLADMIFLDASHDYENVLADIKAWQPLLAPGGLMCGHDFGGSFNGVQNAVRVFYPKARKVGAGSIWVTE